MMPQKKIIDPNPDAGANKQELISERKAGLPLPDQPPTASDWNSADARNVNLKDDVNDNDNVGSRAVPDSNASSSLTESGSGSGSGRGSGSGSVSGSGSEPKNEPSNVKEEQPTRDSTKKTTAGAGADKQDVISQRKANLPLPDQPPTASDWNSADARNVNLGAGGGEGGNEKPGLSGGSSEPKKHKESESKNSGGRESNAREAADSKADVGSGDAAATASTTTGKQSLIEERQAALPLPEQPPVASDWNSADARNVNV